MFISIAASYGRGGTYRLNRIARAEFQMEERLLGGDLSFVILIQGRSSIGAYSAHRAPLPIIRTRLEVAHLSRTKLSSVTYTHFPLCTRRVREVVDAVCGKHAIADLFWGQDTPCRLIAFLQ